MTALVVFVIAGLVVYACRSAFVLVVGDRHLPEQVERSLGFVGPSVLAALVASYLTAHRGISGFAHDAPAVAGTVVALVVARWRRSFAPAFVAAMATYAVVATLR